MRQLLKILSEIFKKQEFLILPSGNKFFYTRNGFGIEQTPENKRKHIKAFMNKQLEVKRKYEN